MVVCRAYVTRMLSLVNGFVWGAPTLILILGVGLFLTLRLKAVQLRMLPRAVMQLVGSLGKKTDSVSPARALCTALAATVGTGNLVGVAGALCLGGPGAVFWMWICGLLGMAVKYAETVLAIRYREETPEGFNGGPMYVMVRGLGEGFRPMAKVYCVFGILAAFGVGNGVQINSAVAGIRGILQPLGLRLTGTGAFCAGLLLAAVIGSVLLGGAKRIGAAAEGIIPLAAAGYVFLCVLVLVLRRDRIPWAFQAVFLGAFSPKAVTGGMIGSAFQALRIGCSRGVFTNEAGMGTASIAHACADTPHPAQQGLLGLYIQRLSQQIGHFICDPFKIRKCCLLPHRQADAQILRDLSSCGADGFHRQILLQPDQPTANVQTALADHLAVVEKYDIGRAAADIQIGCSAAFVYGILEHAAALAGNDGFQIRAGGGYHKFSGKTAQLVQHCGSIFLPGRFTGDDHRAGVHILWGEARPAEFLRHDFPNGLAVDQHGAFQRCDIDLTFINDLFVNDADPGDAEIARHIFHGDPTEHQLCRRCSNVDSHA